MDINGKVAIVTGGASGLGEATARRLHESGARIVVLDMNPEKGEAVASELGGIFVGADVTDEEQVTAAVAAATELGELRACINCAGIGWAQRTIGRDGTPHDYGAFKKIVEVNLIGTFNVIRLVASAMNDNTPDDDNQRGAIVNTASVAAFDGQIGQVSYSASKGGIVGMTLPIARDLSPVGIRINTIAPGLMDTPLFALMPDEARDALGASVPFPKRLGYPAEFGTLAHELVANNYMNGETIRLDGALRMPPK